MIAIVIGVVEIVDQPPWVPLAFLLIVSLVGPSGVLRISLLTRRRYIEKNHKRRVDLEKRLDPSRESSADDV